MLALSLLEILRLDTFHLSLDKLQGMHVNLDPLFPSLKKKLLSAQPEVDWRRFYPQDRSVQNWVFWKFSKVKLKPVISSGGCLGLF